MFDDPVIGDRITALTFVFNPRERFLFSAQAWGQLGPALPASTRVGAACNRHLAQGKSLWKVWETSRRSGEGSHRTELRPPPGAQRLLGNVCELVERVRERGADQPGRLVVV